MLIEKDERNEIDGVRRRVSVSDKDFGRNVEPTAETPCAAASFSFLRLMTRMPLLANMSTGVLMKRESKTRQSPSHSVQ